MIKYIDLKCPALVNFYYNINNGNITMINDTVDLYDEVEISAHSKHISKIYINNKLIIGDNLILKAIKVFFDYTHLPITGIIVKINKHIPEQMELFRLDNIAIGVILALNTYYKLELNERELIKIASLVSKELPLFLYSGYLQISNFGETVIKLEENRCDNYLVALSNLKDNWRVSLDLNSFSNNDISYTGQFYNCLETMAPRELLELKNRLLELKAKKVSINGISNSVIACFNNQHERFIAREALKNQKIKTLICKPVDEIKISRRYK